MDRAFFMDVFAKPNQVVEVHTEHDFMELMKIADEIGMKWFDGKKATSYERFDVLKDKLPICINFNNGRYITIGFKNFYKGMGCSIMTFVSPKTFKVNMGKGLNEHLPQPQKSLLKSGDMVVFRNGDERYVLVETSTLHFKTGNVARHLNNFCETLTHTYENRVDIMRVYRNGELIMKRTEKSERELEVERIQAEMAKLSKRLDELK